MHTGHILLVEAESEEEAIDKVQSAITHADEPTPIWSDWHEVGGRWDDYFGEHGHVLQYSKDEELAEKSINSMIELRKNSMRDAWEKVKTLDVEAAIENYNPDVHNFDMDFYYLEKIGKNLNESWTPESLVYDLDTWTPNLKYFRGRVAIAPEMQFLVVVDFHF